MSTRPSSVPSVLRGRSQLWPPHVGEYKVGLYMVTSLCGLIDAVCFLALGGVFAEMMTGNMLLFALSAGTGAELGDLRRYAAALGAFVVGAVIGGRMLRCSPQLAEKRVGFLVEWLLILAAALVAIWITPDAHNTAGKVVMALLAMAMGVQNALVRAHGVPDLATNVMTLTLAALIADSRLAGGDRRHATRRMFSIGLFVCSAGVGAVLLHYFGVWVPLATAAAIMALALPALLLGSMPNPDREHARRT